MKSLLYVGGPLILFLGFSFWSDAITYGNQPSGMVHLGGLAVVQEDTYMCDENGNDCVLVDSTTEVIEVEDGAEPAGVSQSANYRIEESSTGFADVNGLEIEPEPIEYREGTDDMTVTKQPGIAKYANITFKRPSGFDWKSLRFTFQREAALQEVRDEYDAKQKEMETEGAE